MMSRENHNRFVLIIGLLLFPQLNLHAFDKNDAWTNFSKASQLYMQNGSQKEMISLLKNAQKYAEDPVLYCRASFLLADVYQQQFRFVDAQKLFQKIYKSKLEIPLNLIDETKLRQGQLYLSANKIDKAIANFTSVAANDSSLFLQHEARFALAWHWANQNQWQRCDSLLQKVVSANPVSEQDQRVNNLLARQAIANNEPATAINLLKDTQNKPGLKYLARAYEMSGKQIMAVSIYKKIHDGFSNSSEAEDALFQASQVFMRAGDWLAAKSELNRLLQYFPNSKYTDAIHFQLGWIYLNLDELDQALEAFRFHPTSEYATYYNYMEAECMRRIGAYVPEKLQESIRLFNRIVSLDLQSPIAPLAKVKAAVTEMEKGDTTSAVISLRQFLSLYAKNDLIPVVNFLIATNQDQNGSKNYFDNILQLNTSGEILDAAYFALQSQDYQQGNYQQMISRHSMLTNNDSSSVVNDWQRANHLLLAEAAYFLKHYDLAMTEYDKVEQGNSGDLAEKAALGKAWCAFQKQEWETALSMFRSLKRQLTGGNQVNASYGLATVFYHQGKYKEALQEYPVEITVEDHPELIPLITQSFYRSAECYYRLQYYAQAIETWQKLVILFPESELVVDAMYQVADTYFRANHFSQADSSFQRVLDDYPESPFAVESALRLAQSAYNAGNYQVAAERYQSFITTYPTHKNSKDALDGIQLCYYQLGQADQATDVLRKVIEQSSNENLSADARYRIAVNYLQEEKYDDAILAFKEILTLYPNSSYATDAQFAIGKSLLATENYDDATRELLRFIQYFPESSQLAEAYYLLGIGYQRLESYLSAIDYFNKTADQFPESDFCAASLQNIAWCFDRLNEKVKALDYFDKYLSAYPYAEDQQRITLQKGRLLYDLDQAESAVSIFEELQKTENPDILAEASYRLGVVYISQNNVQKALNAFHAAIDKGQNENYYRLSSIAQLAAIYENSGQQDKAISAYELLVNSTTESQWVTAAKGRISALSPTLPVKNK